MNDVLKVFLSMSVSGSLVIAVLLLGKRLWKDKISRQWQYYIWLAAVVRLLVPFAPGISLMGETYQAVDLAISQNTALPQMQDVSNHSVLFVELEAHDTNGLAEYLTDSRPAWSIAASVINYLWLAWLIAALVMIVRKVTIYQSFIRYVKAGAMSVSDIETLNRLSSAAEQAGVKTPVDLCINPLISSPLLIGFFHPCIVLPKADIPEKDFQYTALHELIHYKRGDIFYKWLVQAVLCLHWFNPLVYLMSREITRDCEFSCDEAVLAKTGYSSAQDYGQTLLDAMAAVGKYKESLGAVTLSENKQLLKERLGAIMNFRKKSKAVKVLTGLLTVSIAFGTAFIGVYPVSAASPKPDKPYKPSVSEKDSISKAEKYYRADSIPLFEAAFYELDETEQSTILDMIYTDGDISFFSIALQELDWDSPLPATYAERAYQDVQIGFFSVASDYLNNKALEEWLDKAIQDKRISFQSVLMDKLDREDEWENELEAKNKKWAEQQVAEYRAYGITMKGKHYYYNGQLTRIFLDQRPNKSFYTLEVNPKGTVTVKVVRDATSGEIQGVSYMTEAEVRELFGDDMDIEESWFNWDILKSDPEKGWADSQETKIQVNIPKVKKGEYAWLGTYSLNKGDRVFYHVSAKEGTDLAVGFAKPGQDIPNPVYNTVSVQNQDGNLSIKSGPLVWGEPVPDGEYRLFVHARDGDITNAEGFVMIVKAS